MFRELRRIKQALTLEESKELLKKTRRATLALLGDLDYTYSVPINYFYDEEDNAIYFHSALVGHKVDSIRKHEKISMSIIGDEYLDDSKRFYYVKSVIIFGTISIVLDEELRYKKLKEFGMKYFKDLEYTEKELKENMARCLLVKIDIDHISGKLVHEK